MSQEDKFLMILEKISEVGERTARMEVEQRNMKEDLEEVKRQDVVQNQLLAEHIAGVNTANARLTNEIKIREEVQAKQQELEGRIIRLEAPRKFIEQAKTYLLWIAASAGAIVTLLELLEYFKK